MSFQSFTMHVITEKHETNLNIEHNKTNESGGLGCELRTSHGRVSNKSHDVFCYDVTCGKPHQFQFPACFHFYQIFPVFLSMNSIFQNGINHDIFRVYFSISKYFLSK